MDMQRANDDPTTARRQQEVRDDPSEPECDEERGRRKKAWLVPDVANLGPPDAGDPGEPGLITPRWKAHLATVN
jgi:hypothetical protein